MQVGSSLKETRLSFEEVIAGGLVSVVSQICRVIPRMSTSELLDTKAIHQKLLITELMFSQANYSRIAVSQRPNDPPTYQYGVVSIQAKITEDELMI
jgi:hypothetical protein